MLKLKKRSEKLQLGFSIPLHIYPCDILFSFRQDDAELSRMLKDKGAPQSAIDEELHKWTPNCGARFVFYNNGVGLVRMNCIPTTPLQISHLAHEIFHIVVHVMNWVGVRLELEKSEEAYAYLTSYLTEEVYKLLLPHYETIKVPKRK